MKILGISVHRGYKLSAPLTCVNHDAIELDVDSGVIWRYMVLLVRLKNYIGDRKPDVIISRGLTLCGGVSLLFGKLINAKVIVVIPGYLREPAALYREPTNRFSDIGVVKRYWYILLNSVNRLILKNMDGYIVVSKDLKQSLVNLYNIDEEVIAVNGICIDVERFDNNIQNTKKSIVLTVTDFDHKGKMEGAIRAMAAMIPVLRDNQNWKYVIAGNGEHFDAYNSWVEEKIKGENIRHQIEIMGFAHNVYKIYATADIFLYISFLDGTPNVVHEAQAASLPIVTNSDFGMVEQISNGKTGYLVNKESIDDIELAVRFLIKNPKQRKRLGTNANRYVKNYHNPKCIGHGYINAVTKILDLPEDEFINYS